MSWMDALKWLSPRRRAERLIQAQIDAGRGEGKISEADEAWLARRLARDPGLAAYAEAQAKLQAALRATAEARTPPSAGFAARVAEAARVRPMDALPTLNRAQLRGDEGTPWAWVATATAVAAVVALVVVQQQPAPRGPAPVGGLEVSGRSGGALVAPDFEIRAPGVGAARARVQITAIVERHDGQPSDEPSGLYVRLPRAELVPVLRDLAVSGTFKVTPLREGPLPADVQTVVLRFVLD